MKIQSINNNGTAVGFRGGGAERLLSKAADFSSVQQRLALGAFAVVLQPMIDLKNKDLDEDTRKVSAIRSIAKAAIGTLTGIIIRGATITGANKHFAQKDAAGEAIRAVKENGKKGGYLTDVDKIKKTFGSSLSDDAARRVPSVIGTMVALGVMVFTNFLIDAPLTNAAMNKINKIVNKNFPSKEKGNQNGEVANA